MKINLLVAVLSLLLPPGAQAQTNLPWQGKKMCRRFNL